ncbi:Transcriptional regulator, GntR family [Cronobacter turicensis 564]|nr:Transcriptional regulator, GntR family [Cronobacter turicensis 564]
MPFTARQRAAPPEAQGDRIYRLMKQEIFDFRLLPGDRFSENDVAARMGASR